LGRGVVLVLSSRVGCGVCTPGHVGRRGPITLGGCAARVWKPFRVAPAARVGGLCCWIALLGKEFVRLFLMSKTDSSRRGLCSAQADSARANATGHESRRMPQATCIFPWPLDASFDSGGGPTTGCGRPGVPRGAPMRARSFLPYGCWVRTGRALRRAAGWLQYWHGLPPKGVGVRRSEL
jgi:hypothetical protein